MEVPLASHPPTPPQPLGLQMYIEPEGGSYCMPPCRPALHTLVGTASTLNEAKLRNKINKIFMRYPLPWCALLAVSNCSSRVFIFIRVARKLPLSFLCSTIKPTRSLTASMSESV